MKKMILFLIAALMAAGIVAVVLNNRKGAEAAMAKSAKAKNAPVPVLLTPVRTMTMPVVISTFGSVEPLTTVAIKSRITGNLAKVCFAEGQDVKAGDLLFEIDPRSPEALLKQSEAMLAKDRIQLENALKEAGRQETLLKKGISAQDVRDEAVTAADTLKAVVQSDEAAVDNVRLQLGYCSIRSPVSGRTGNLLLHQGNLVKADDATLVTINQLRPILVRFVLPQRELIRVRDRMDRGGLPVIASPQGAVMLSETGSVTFIDNAVSETTGTIQLKARFENETQALWPGQFVKVVLVLAMQENAMVVPESAVLLGQQGAYVYVTDRDGRVNPRPVVVDRTVDGMSVVVSGLTLGEVIVMDGQLRLKPGALVKSRLSSKDESSPAGRP
ncbi:MAG: efflux RND transporter periplasmic adaptor subunit [bacterium]